MLSWSLTPRPVRPLPPRQTLGPECCRGATNVGTSPLPPNSAALAALTAASTVSFRDGSTDTLPIRSTAIPVESCSDHGRVGGDGV